jgi:hypothetical protein
MIGYSLGAFGLILCTQAAQSDSVWLFIACFSLATFGVEMTLSPSWAFCMDIGGSRSGAVSAAMNMVGNLGAALSAVAFPFFVANVTIPVIAETTGTANSFFVFAATMNALAVIAWIFMNPRRPLKEISAAALRTRLVVFLGLIVLVVTALVYTKFLLPANKAKETGSLQPAPQLVLAGSYRRHPTPLTIRSGLIGRTIRCGDSLSFLSWLPSPRFGERGWGRGAVERVSLQRSSRCLPARIFLIPGVAPRYAPLIPSPSPPQSPSAKLGIDRGRREPEFRFPMAASKSPKPPRFANFHQSTRREGEGRLYAETFSRISRIRSSVSIRAARSVPSSTPATSSRLSACSSRICSSIVPSATRR